MESNSLPQTQGILHHLLVISPSQGKIEGVIRFWRINPYCSPHRRFKPLSIQLMSADRMEVDGYYCYWAIHNLHLPHKTLGIIYHLIGNLLKQSCNCDLVVPHFSIVSARTLFLISTSRYSVKCRNISSTLRPGDTSSKALLSLQ